MILSNFSSEKGGAMKLIIRDYDQRFVVWKAQSPSVTAYGFGLKSMKERTELSGGSFE
jgi:signal transduction histidine kinase